MKKAILFVALTTLAGSTMVSCGKSTKGKMDGEWNVDSIKTTETDGSSSDSFSIDGTSLTITNTSGGSTSTSTGTVEMATWNIKKDGTWDREVSFTVTQSGSSQKSTLKSSGNWDFQGGVGEYKKNERVVFSTLSETTTNVTTIGGSSSTSTSTDTYLDGENSEIFTITESKKKSLALESKGAMTSTNGSFTSSSSKSTTVTMSLK